MLLEKACPQCTEGGLIVDHGSLGSIAICRDCGYAADLETVRRLSTLRALAAQRAREKGPGA